MAYTDEVAETESVTNENYSFFQHLDCLKFLKWACSDHLWKTTMKSVHRRRKRSLLKPSPTNVKNVIYANGKTFFNSPDHTFRLTQLRTNRQQATICMSVFSGTGREHSFMDDTRAIAMYSFGNFWKPSSI